MADYNLAALSSRDFEHLIQALAMRTISSALTPFGDGPDGAREATCNCKTLYPSGDSPWDGYVVVQCKFLVRNSLDAKKAGAWALRELKRELTKLQSPA